MYNIKNIVLIFAQSRSGHHAVTDWIFEQYGPDKLFFNFNDPLDFDPMFGDRVQYYLNDKKYYRVISNSWVESGVVEKKLEEFSKETPENIDIIQNGDKNLLILNYENIEVEKIDSIYNLIHSQFPDAHISKVVVLRDLLNLVASKIKVGKELTLKNLDESDEKILDIVDLWKDYCRYSIEKKDCITIVYNNWFKDDQYRRELSLRLKTDFYRENLPNLSTFGGGSSFDGYSQNKNAAELDVLQRWKEYSKSSSFMNLWYCDDVRRYTETIFGKNIYINQFMDTKETVKFGEKSYEFEWVEGGEIPSQDVSQASGYVFNKNKELLIVKNKNWTIPGGHPEAGESAIETLKREVMEEAMVEIDNISYLGHVKVTDLETNEIKHQLRFTAFVCGMNDFEKKFETSERNFIDPKDLTSYIPWASGKVFTLEVQAAISKLV